MQHRRSHRPKRIRGAVLGIVSALLLAFPLGVLASHQFADVPNSNLFHNDIDALVDAGVTAGCGGGNYCPNQAVTRGQMAAFMNRLGALAPGKTPVVNADRIDGIDSTGFHRYNANAPGLSTQYGLMGVSGNATGAGTFDAGYASFPVPLGTAPTANIILPGDPLPAGCTGSATAPGASGGNLCIWITYQLNATDHTVFNQSGSGGASRFGFIVDMSSVGAGNYAFNAVYAVTAAAGLTTSGEPEPGGPALGTPED